jgi:flagellar hook-associated protein 3 FlgL
LFNVRLDGKDNNDINSPGSGKVSINATGVTADGSGTEFDQASGLQIVNGGKTYTIDLQAAETVEDLLNIVNGSGADVLAEINVTGTGINIRSRLSGADFSIGENGGLTATHLGLRSLTSGTQLAELNHGAGVTAGSGTDFVIHRRDGFDLEIDVSSASSIGDVIDLINNHVDNQDPATAVVARLAEFGNGLELVDANAAGTDDLSVIAQFGRDAAVELGLIPLGQTQSVPPSANGASQTLRARDVNPLETDGVFNTLTRLIEAIESSDQGQLERVAALLDGNINSINFSRSEIGARQQGLDVLGRRLEDEQVELQRSLSVEIDVDLVAAISEFTARQASFQASLQTTAQTFQLTLLDFL